MSTSHRIEVPGPLDGERIDRVVAFLVGIPRSEAVALIDLGQVGLDDRPVSGKSQRVSVGQVLQVAVPERDTALHGDASVELHIVHSDDAVVVIDKQPGLVVHPGAGNPEGTLVQGLLAAFPAMTAEVWPDPRRPGIVHRLDKGTSGLLMAARTPGAQLALSAQLESRSVERRYLALVWGTVEQSAGVVDAPIGRSVRDPTRMTVRGDGRRAVTRYEVIRQWREPQPTTLVRCALETGRTHQIRVHLAAIGHPVVGDGRYETAAVAGSRGRRGATVVAALRPRRPFLHAEILGFDHPTSGDRLRFESALPADLVDVVDALA
ncbi:MAG: RluA family pseudouridine synthase [Acidimicrobiales bacterium]